MRKTLGFLAFVALICAPSAFFGSYYGAQSLHVASAQVAPLGNGGPSVAAADSSLTVTGGYSAAVNTANSFAWSAVHNWSQTTSSACPGAGTPAGGTGTIASEYGSICMGPVTGTTSLVIGKTCGSSWNTGTVACNSGALTFAQGTNGADRICTIYGSSGTGGLVETGSAACGLTLNGSLDLGIYPLLRATYITQGAANNFGGTCTAATNTCTITMVHGFTTALCFGVDQTTAAPVKATASGTTLTLTNASPGGATDVLGGFCIGNPS